MKNELRMCAGAIVCAALCGWGCREKKPVLVCNEDNDRYFYLGDKWHTEQGMTDYFDSLAAGGAMTHYVMCVGGQRTSYASEVWEPVWAGLNDPNNQGMTNDLWAVNAKKIHDRGLDPWAIWIRRAREKGVSPWLSMRMNDTHFAERKNCFRNESRFYDPKYRSLKCQPNADAVFGGAWDYSKSEVRAHALDLVKEILRRWDMDGLELDWLRFCRHLPDGRGALDAHFITGFMRDARREAGLAAKRLGHPVKIAARVPTNFEAALPMGLDVEAWARERLVDAVVCCNFYTTSDFNFDLARWTERLRAADPDLAVLPGFCNRVCPYPNTQTMSMDADRAFFRAWASLYGKDSPGVYIFNAFYFNRETQKWFLSGGLGQSRLAEGSRRYPVFFHDIGAKGVKSDVQLPRPLDSARKYSVRVRRLPGDTGVCVRLGFDKSTDLPRVSLNGTAFQTGPARIDIEKIRFTKTASFAAEWTFPPAALADGLNTVALEPVAGGDARCVWCEIAVGK